MTSTTAADRTSGSRVSTIVGVAALLACCACGGSANADDGEVSRQSTVASAGTTPLSGAADDASASDAGATARPAQGAPPDGKAIFARCATCHQPTGEGLQGAYPPLAGSEIVAGKAAGAIAIVLHGVQGPVTVKGQQYNSFMPPFGTGAPLSDGEVAAVLTYVRSSWGNGASAVTPAQVAATRVATASHTGPLTPAEVVALMK